MQIRRKHGWLSYHGGAIALLTIAVLGLVTQACTPSSSTVDLDTEKATIGVNVGDLAPDFTLIDLDGNQLSLSDFRGKMVFINFWATWCPPCRAEMPEMEAIHQEYKAEDVIVIGVDILESEDKVRQFIEHGGYSWTFVIDATGAVAADYNINVIPTSYFIDEEGIIRAVDFGAMTKRTIEARLAEMMN